MPVRYVRTNLGYDAALLVNELAAEWRTSSGVADAPLILVDEPKTWPIHLIVVWDKWRDVPADERSTLIMQAFARTDPSPDRLNHVTIAMGVTKAEAMTMGLPTE